MDLHDALARIAEIRQQVAQTETFRGYRAVPLGISGVLALAAASLQPLVVADPGKDLLAYLLLWLGAAFFSLAVTAVAMVLHCRHSPQALTRPATLLAVSQFLPSIVAGALLTLVLVRHVPQAAWMLPGLWSVLFSLGIFASFRLLPRAVFWAGMWYLFAGLYILAHYQDDIAFSPWIMGLNFGAGQLLTAAILYWTLERRHGEA